MAFALHVINHIWVICKLLWCCLQVVNRVRGSLTKLERKTLSALIVIDVHSRDVVTALHEKDISSEADFEWTAQLR